jgi:hypothetical protein
MRVTSQVLVTFTKTRLYSGSVKYFSLEFLLLLGGKILLKGRTEAVCHSSKLFFLPIPSGTWPMSDTLIQFVQSLILAVDLLCSETVE